MPKNSHFTINLEKMLLEVMGLHVPGASFVPALSNEREIMNNLVPPNNIEAEQSIIGSILKENDCFDDVSEIINASQFYSRSHRLIFSAIEELVQTGTPADLVTVTDQLENKSQLEDAGGFIYVAEIMRNTHKLVSRTQF